MVKKGSGWGTPVPTTPPSKGGTKKSSGGSGWGTPIGGSSSTAAPKPPPPRDPQTELVRKLAQLSQLRQQARSAAAQPDPNVTAKLSSLVAQVRSGIKGYSGKDIQKLGASAAIDPAVVKELSAYANDPSNPIEQGVSKTLGDVMTVANTPYRTVTGAIGEWSKQGENNPQQVGPVSLRLIPTDLGKIAEGALNGFTGKSNESPLTIMQKAGRIRQKQGVGTEAFGVLPHTNIAKGEPLPYLGKAGGIGVDVAASIPLDPLSWVTFGLSAEGRAGLRTVQDTLGAEKAMEVAKGGVKVLSAEENARLGANTLKLLKNTGGLGVRVPQPLKALREGAPMFGPSKTVLRTKGLTEPLAKLGEKALTTKAAAPLRSLERTFKPRAALLQAERDAQSAIKPGTAKLLDELRVKAMGATHLGEADLNRMAFGRKAAGLSEAENRALTSALEAGSKAGLDEKLTKAFDYLDKYRKEIGPELRARTLIPPEATGTIADVNYVPHVAASPEAAAYLGKQNREAAMSMATGGPPTDITRGPGGYTRNRSLTETVPQINDQLGHNVEGGKVFTEDPFLAFAKHGVQARHDIATRDFLTGVSELTDKSGLPLMQNIEKLGEQFPRDLHGSPIIPDGMTKLDVPGHGTFVVDKALAPEISKITRLTSGNETTKAFLAGLDKWMALWKGYATVPPPFGLGFHMRNATSNVMLNWLADISPTDPAYAEAFSIQRKLEKGFKEGEPYKYLSGRTKDIAQQALNHDILKSGFLVGNQDIPRDLMRGFEGKGTQVAKGLNPLNSDNYAIRVGRAMGSGIEENARLAHFIAKLRTFKNPDEAAASVRKYLFDYSDLTGVEQDVFKRVMPFYTFTRKNTPLWIAAAVKQPGKYSRVAQWFGAAGAANQMPGPVPGYMTEGGAANTGIGGKTPWIATPDTPMGAAFKNVVNPAAELAGLAPGGAPEAFSQLSQNVGGGLPGALKAVYDAYVQKRDPFTGAPLNTPQQQRDLVENQLFPLLTKLTGIADDSKRKRRLLSMLTGIQATPYDQNTKNAAAWEKLDALVAYLSKLKKQGVDVGQMPGSNPNSKKKKTPVGFGGATAKAKGW